MAVNAVVEPLAAAASHDLHEFSPDEVSLLDPSAVDPARIHGPRQLTDIYLLAVASAHRGRLVTFDKGIPLEEVPRAQRRKLLVI